MYVVHVDDFVKLKIFELIHPTWILLHFSLGTQLEAEPKSNVTLKYWGGVPIVILP